METSITEMVCGFVLREIHEPLDACCLWLKVNILHYVYFVFLAPDVVGIGLRFPAVICFFCFVKYPRSSLNGIQPSFFTCSELSHIWKYMSKIWGRLPLKLGLQTTNFRGFSATSQLSGNFEGEYLWNETWWRAGTSPSTCQNFTNWSTNCLK